MTANTRVLGFLSRLEALGNRLPHPTWLFVYFCGIVIALSAVLSAFNVAAVHPVSSETISVNNLLSRDGLQWILSNTVRNFTGFAPLGTVLVAIMGLGIAEHFGLIAVLLKVMVNKAPAKLLSFVVVLAGVLSSIAADAGYVVLVPLAAMLFISMGRSPLLGIAAAFAGVSGGYSANVLIGPLDAILAGISTESAHLIDPSYSVSPAGNYYFILASTLMVALLATWVTEVIIAPKFDKTDSTVLPKDKPQEVHSVTKRETKALQMVALFTCCFVGLLLLGILPENGVLRHTETGSIIRSPLFSGIVTIIAFYAAVAGCIYGYFSGQLKHHKSIIEAMEGSMVTMASYLVLMFFAAQFVNYFKWTDLGVIFAIKGAAGLAEIGLGALPTLIGFVLLAAGINLLIGSSSAKWALIAPVFVPMFLLLGISPEATQVAYRIGDSSTNIITPLMPYFGVIVAFAQRYEPATGMGTIMAMMLPYSVVLLLGWSLLLGAWLLLGLPLGPDAMVLLAPR